MGLDQAPLGQGLDGGLGVEGCKLLGQSLQAHPTAMALEQAQHGGFVRRQLRSQWSRLLPEQLQRQG